MGLRQGAPSHSQRVMSVTAIYQQLYCIRYETHDEAQRYAYAQPASDSVHLHRGVARWAARPCAFAGPAEVKASISL